MRIVFVTLVFLIGVSGCADSHRVVRGVQSGTSFSASDSFYISVPRDGIYGKTEYTGSGLTTAQMISSALSKYVREAESGHSVEDFRAAIETARSKKYRFLVFPKILHWEDRATEWSGIPDKAEIKIEIVSVETEQTVDSVVITGRSGLATFGGDHPQDLLFGPVNDFISSLFKR